MERSRFILLPGTLILLLVLTFSLSCNNSSKTIAGLSVDTLDLADAKMKAYVDEGKLPYISTLVIKDGNIVRRSTFGLEEDAIFRIYSMSKPVTAAALMILYDEGKFQLDDAVKQYIPEFENTKVWVEGVEVDQ